MVSIECVTMDKAIPYLQFFASSHLAETGFSEVPDVDWELYEALGKAGRMLAFLLKDAGKIVGYALFSLGTNPRSKSIWEANGDGLYVDRPYRVRWSSKLIQTAIKELKSIGVKSIDIITDDEVVGRWLKKNGAKNQYKVWSF